MTDFTEVPATDIGSNPFRLIGREWMLITAGTRDAFNTMTASWGALGHLWGRDVAICYVRPQRYTYGFMERSSVYTLSFFDEAWRAALDYCGSHSGRDVDKMAQTGLIPLATSGGAVGFEQARLILECRKLYAGDIEEAAFVDREVMEQAYSRRDFHRFYVGEITRTLSR